MGVYASFIDAIDLGGPEAELDAPCTACYDSGYITYPVTVMPEKNELDPCPYGCIEKDEDNETDIEPVPTAQKWWPTHFERTTNQYGMPYEQQRRRQRKAESQLIGAWHMRRLRPPGRITTDVPVTGFLNGTWCTVPAYLPGTPIEEGLWTLEVAYEYIGAKVNIEYLGASKALFRFAYAFEEGYSTREMLQ